MIDLKNKKVITAIIIFNVITAIALIDLYMTFGNDLFNPGKAQREEIKLYNGAYKEVNRLVLDGNINILNQGPNDSILYSKSNILCRINPPKEVIKTPFDESVTAVSPSEKYVYVAAGNKLFTLTYEQDNVKKELISELNEKSVILSIAINEKLIFVSDTNDKTVKAIEKKSGDVIFDIKGEPKFLFPGPFAPIALYNDQIWIADTGRHQLQIYNFRGEYLSTWIPDELFPGCCNPTDFTIVENGNIITMQKGISEIKMFSPTGEKICNIAPTNAFKSVSSKKKMAVFNEDAIVIYDPDFQSLRFFIKGKK
jgi:hypothetical protein